MDSYLKLFSLYTRFLNIYPLLLSSLFVFFVPTPPLLFSSNSTSFFFPSKFLPSPSSFPFISLSLPSFVSVLHLTYLLLSPHAVLSFLFCVCTPFHSHFFYLLILPSVVSVFIVPIDMSLFSPHSLHSSFVSEGQWLFFIDHLFFITPSHDLYTALLLPPMNPVSLIFLSYYNFQPLLPTFLFILLLLHSTTSPLASGVGVAHLVVEDARWRDTGVYLCHAANQVTRPPPAITKFIVTRKYSGKEEGKRTERDASWVTLDICGDCL